MKIKTHKIPGIDKSTCTAEQKIAYNYAFSYIDIGRKILKADATEINKSDGLHQVEQLILKDICSREDMKKYNADAIIIAFRQGFRNYCEKFFIAHNYDEIGKCFAIPYEII